MGRWIEAAAIATMALILAREASASFQTGKDLLRNCRDISDSGYGLCLGYVEGVVDAMEADRLSHHWPPCIREGVEASEVHNVVIKYLHDHPENLKQAASALVIVAVGSAWQCAQTGQ